MTQMRLVIFSLKISYLEFLESAKSKSEMILARDPKYLVKIYLSIFFQFNYYFHPFASVVHRDFRDDILGCYTNFEISMSDQNPFGAYEEVCKAEL